MCFALGHNTVGPECGSNPRPLDPESEALTTRPPRSLYHNEVTGVHTYNRHLDWNDIVLLNDKSSVENLEEVLYLACNKELANEL